MLFLDTKLIPKLDITVRLFALKVLSTIAISCAIFNKIVFFLI